jgi:hypothetical protein
MIVGKALRTVSALQQKPAAIGHITECLGQVIDFTGKH